jgi:uncharacterized protein DUF6519
MTIDISRATFDPRKRYASVRMQQGRVLLDDDFNEAERIDDELERRELLDLIGPTGTPDDGFKIAGGRLNPLGELTFDILPGTLYLGGLRLWNPAVQTYAEQDDWLEQAAAARAVPTDGRIDLVYLQAWQQPVTAVEDAELFEAALAGPDTAARLRTMWRVHLATGVTSTDCAPAWQTLVGQWQATRLGTIDDTGERTVDAQLTVGFELDTAPVDLCSPPVAGGYLGAENQAIRVQLVDSGHFTWGFDNAAPLYRVQVAADHTTITLLTDPKDQAHWPRAGQIVEILPWSAVLPNHEKVAALSGHLSRVQGSYDPDAHTLTLATPIPAGFGEDWKGREHHGQLGPAYYFLRVWNRGDDQLSAVAISFSPGTAVALGNTGLTVTWSGTQLVGNDAWIIAARPETPDRVVPWVLEAGRGPDEVRRFFTPLAVIRWKLGANTSASFTVLSDCRVPFQPLTRLRGCCTYTVGDRKTSWGQFDSIQAAVNNLPASGGKICVLPGEYRESVTLFGKHDVTIEGCGRRSKILVPAELGIGILIVGSQDIVIRDLVIDAGNSAGIILFDALGATPVSEHEGDGSAPLFDRSRPAVFSVPRAQRVDTVLLDSLEIHVQAFPAVGAIGGRNLTLRCSSLVGAPLDDVIGKGSPDAGRWPLVYLLSDNVVIEDNELVAAPDPIDIVLTGAPTFTRTAMGGIQIGGGSEQIEIRRNTITAGNGNGVTLGSYAWVAKKAADTGDFVVISGAWSIARPGFHFILNDEGCVEIVWDPIPPGDGDGTPLVPVSMGAVQDVRIVDNTITGMGGAGIGIARYFDLSGRDDVIVTDRLTIEHNRIRECLRLPIPELPLAMRDLAAAGAIALGAGTLIGIRDNDLERNGRSHVDPVCGVFALLATGLVVERNRIVYNAPRIQTSNPPRPGLRGGVVVMLARPPAVHVQTDAAGEVLRGTGFPAARIHGNLIVVPEGRTIVVIGIGAMAITSNQLTSRGVGTANRGAGGATGGGGATSNLLDALGGATVAVINTGMSNEIGMQLASYTAMKDISLDPSPGIDRLPAVLTGGDVLFHDNQIKLDLLEQTVVAVTSSILLVTFDDLSFDGNQCEVEQDRDLVATNLFALAWSLRASGNRFEESLIAHNGIVNGISALGIATLGTMTGNQASHCLFLAAALRVFTGNIELIRAFTNGGCQASRSVGGRFAQRYVGPTADYNKGD